MKRIPLSQAKFALVDDCDYEWLSQWKWSFDGQYARRTEARKGIRMHRVIVENLAVGNFQDTDHINGNKLDNRRANLRPVSRCINTLNRPLQRNNISGFRGVMWYKQTEKWHAQIKARGKKHHLGYFDYKVDAARAYNKAAIKHFGEFARLNEV